MQLHHTKIRSLIKNREVALANFEEFNPTIKIARVS